MELSEQVDVVLKAGQQAWLSSKSAHNLEGDYNYAILEYLCEGIYRDSIIPPGDHKGLRRHVEKALRKLNNEYPAENIFHCLSQLKGK